ncbi:MAG TPA: hypothetical protein VGL77_13660 [Armatimonadota bacterium]|jgi:hypothetical protein
MASTQRFEWHGEAISKVQRAAAADGLLAWAEDVLQVVNDNYIPLDEGTLMRSGESDVDRNELVASAFYDTPYAVAQHELPFHHANGRIWKYLERGSKERAQAGQEYVAQKVRAVTGG